ncbi:MAG: TRAP transporter TatT component family protein [Deltaproteobacteria bacterium]
MNQFAARHKINQVGQKIPLFLLSLFLLILQNGCVRMAISQFNSTMQTTLERQKDIDLLYQGLPTLLLLNQTMLADHPNDTSLLLNSVRAESSYADLLQVYGEKERARQHAKKARGYACRLLDKSLALPDACTSDIDVFASAVAAADKDKTGALFWSAAALATDLQLEQGAPAAAALLPRAQTIMTRLASTAPTYYHGGPHIFLGTLYGMFPPMLGGNPDRSKANFEEALKINHRRFLLTQVLYAESYARQTLNRGLFERLLQEVIAADIKDPDLQSANALAKKQAAQLLQQVNRYF